LSKNKEAWATAEKIRREASTHTHTHTHTSTSTSTDKDSTDKNIHKKKAHINIQAWIDDKTKTIKAMTIKGLEPEIQRLIAQHKTDTKRIEACPTAHTDTHAQT
jgi:hypothetical protein